MGIQAAYAVPHPPLIVPSVGKGEEREIADTIASYEDVARRCAEHSPDTIIITSPHAPAFRDAFFISDTAVESGSLARFGQPQEELTVDVDTQMADALKASLEAHGIPAVGSPYGDEGLDHATFVPLYFLSNAMDISKVRFLRIGLSGLPDEDHRLLGEEIAKVADGLGRKVVLIASGDLSHKLKRTGPYGFAPEGPIFDDAITDIFSRGALTELFELDPVMCDAAAECGLRSFQIMAGALVDKAFTHELLSYEGPFGVGYGVAAFEVIDDPSTSAEEAALEEEVYGSDPLVELARLTVDQYIANGKVPSVPKDMPHEYTKRRAGVFVSLHEHGELRGCIGTISPSHDSIAQEVIANAIAASTQDPRFPAVRPDELDHLEYSVDVLGSPEVVSSMSQLDPKQYGVIVSHGFRRGLLLPDLEGVDTVADQIAIAKRKAGIPLNEDVKVERFEVIRHSAGGAPRIP